MLQRDDYERYINLFFDLLGVLEERKGITEELIKKGREERPANGSVKYKVIENVTAIIFE